MKEMFLVGAEVICVGALAASCAGALVLSEGMLCVDCGIHSLHEDWTLVAHTTSDI